MKLRHARGSLDLDRVQVVGILNRIPDSFYDPGRMPLRESVERALVMATEGAGFVDIGGVKAGPGAPVSEEEELERVVSLVEAVAKEIALPMSVETSRPSVARRALDAGAAIVNDVTGLNDPELATVCAETGAALVLMHHGSQLRGRPRHPRYDDVVEAVTSEWSRLEDVASGAGISRDALVVDPGLDFGKTTYHSLELMRRLPELVDHGLPLLVAASRKDVVGETLALPPGERLEGSLALAALATRDGARLIRVHDVKETVRVVRMVEAVAGSRPPEGGVRGLWD